MKDFDMAEQLKWLVRSSDTAVTRDRARKVHTLFVVLNIRTVYHGTILFFSSPVVFVSSFDIDG